MTSAQRRAQLIEVGLALFAEKGIEGTSVEEIAASAGVSKPLIYEHFGGKEGLYAVVVDREMRALLQLISESLLQGSPRVKAENAALAFLTYIETRSDGFRDGSDVRANACWNGCINWSVVARCAITYARRSRCTHC
jgi:AcrR family transcriptional regulator